MKIVFKIILIIFLITGISVVIPSNVVEGTSSSIIDGIEQKASETDVTNSTTEMAGVVSTILSVLQIIAALVAAVVIATMGFKYIIDTPEVKEQLKTKMMPVIIGIMLVFFALSISKFLIGVFEKNAPTTGNGQEQSEQGEDAEGDET